MICIYKYLNQEKSRINAIPTETFHHAVQPIDTWPAPRQSLTSHWREEFGFYLLTAHCSALPPTHMTTQPKKGQKEKVSATRICNVAVCFDWWHVGLILGGVGSAAQVWSSCSLEIQLEGSFRWWSLYVSDVLSEKCDWHVLPVYSHHLKTSKGPSHWNDKCIIFPLSASHLLHLSKTKHSDSDMKITSLITNLLRLWFIFTRNKKY